MDKMEIFKAQFPDAQFFDENHLQHLDEYLEQKGMIHPSEKIISIEKPGEGNMNFVRRVITNEKSLIVKQCRPWVEKYPAIHAPVERLEVEQNYYQFISIDPFFIPYTPKILCYDPGNLMLILEDLGEGSDLTFMYKKGAKINEEQKDSLLKYISKLHGTDWSNRIKTFPSNQALKQLNYEHIFNYPYLTENGFDLDTVQPGLQTLSLTVKHNESLKKSISALGRIYLAQGPVLIHGDYYPGSWLQVQEEIKVIDPEFAFFGFAEFDPAVMTAHFFMAGMRVSEVKQILTHYSKRDDFNENLFMGFTGTEILRRIIGLAQLPLDLSLNEKAELLVLAQQFITSPKDHQML